MTIRVERPGGRGRIERGKPLTIVVKKSRGEIRWEISLSKSG